VFENYVKKIIESVINNPEILLEQIEISHGYSELQSRMFDNDLDDFEEMFAM